MKRFSIEVVKLWRELRDAYRPELHYMRGPGPRTLAKARASEETQSREPMGEDPGRGPVPPHLS